MQSVIEPAAFHSALLYGAQKVEGKRDELNRSNGFPVPDRDTGNNLAYLMQHLRRYLPPVQSFHELLTKLSEVSLTGARGNSGAIFSQYFSGFTQASALVKEGVHCVLTFQGLAQMFKAGYTSAYRSLQQPREGTILSAMYSFSEAFQQKLASGLDIVASARAALAKLKEAVELSASQLPQQRALHAPDAGAMAFFYFAEGFMHSLLGTAEPDMVPLSFSLPEIAEVADTADALEQSAYRYCTEALMTLSAEGALDAGVKKHLETYGDSLVLSTSGRMARVHLHTNQPAQVIDLLETYGALMEVKADDMRMQQTLAKPHPGKIALVTDSIADVPEELLGEDVFILPLNLLSQGVSYQDKRSISFDRVKRLSGKLTSSQMNLSEVKAFLDPITAQYEQVLILTVSSKMSGIHARIREYMEQGGPAAIRLVDSKVNSGAQGLLTLHAARRIKEGAGLDQTADELEALRERARIFVSLPNLRAMVSSGRLDKRVGAFLQAIGFLPLVTINREGEGTVTGLSFSRARSDRLLLQKIKPDKVANYAVVHVNDRARAEETAQSIERITGMKPEYICDISSIVANFSGETSCAVAFIEK